MSAIDGAAQLAIRQGSLPLSRAADGVQVALVSKQPSFLAAIKLCISLGAFTSSKQIYRELGIDAGQWTRIVAGEANFPLEKLNELMNLCGNEVPLTWLLLQRNYDPLSLRSAETELERKFRLVCEENQALRRILQPSLS